jgi:hypothetical protein
MPYARIKPYNPKKGYTTQTFTVAGNIFRVAEGWYEIGSKLAAYLKTKHVDEQNEDSVYMFDVAETLEDVERITGAPAASVLVPNQTAPARPIDPAADLRAESARKDAAHAVPTVDPGMTAAPAAVPGDGDPEMAARPIGKIPGAPGAKPGKKAAKGQPSATAGR